MLNGHEALLLQKNSVYHFRILIKILSHASLFFHLYSSPIKFSLFLKDSYGYKSPQKSLLKVDDYAIDV